jgi:hypothetical protein
MGLDLMRKMIYLIREVDAYDNNIF